VDTKRDILLYTGI